MSCLVFCAIYVSSFQPLRITISHVGAFSTKVSLVRNSIIEDGFFHNNFGNGILSFDVINQSKLDKLDIIYRNTELIKIRYLEISSFIFSKKYLASDIPSLIINSTQKDGLLQHVNLEKDRLIFSSKFISDIYKIKELRQKYYKYFIYFLPFLTILFILFIRKYYPDLYILILRNNYKVLITFIYFITSFLIVQKLYISIPTIKWVNRFSLEIFTDFSSIVQFYKYLKTGISPIISFFELSEYILFGHMYWMKYYFSYLIIPLNFYLISCMTSNNYYGLILKLSISLILVYGTAMIGGMLYDWYWPFFTIMSIFLFTRKTTNSKLNYLFAFLSGLFLSFSELSRPFMIFIIPFLFIYFYLLTIRNHNNRNRLVVIFTVFLVLSGLWRFKMYIYTGAQFIWSDYGDCNIAESWPSPIGQKISYEYINTPLSKSVCSEPKQKVINHIINHPVESLGIIFGKMYSFIRVNTYWHGMDKNLVPHKLYKYIIRLLFSVFILQGFLILYTIIKDRGNIKKPVNFIYLSVFIIFLFLSIPNNGFEMARFISSISPFLIICVFDNSLTIAFTNFRNRLNK